MADWTIRAATHRDIEPVLALWRAAGASASAGVHFDGLVNLLESDAGALLIAETGEAIVVGSLIAAWDGWRGSFYRLAVHRERRREGIGTALVRAGERRLHGLRASRLTAIVAADDPPAMEFWSAVGYRRQQQRARFIHPPQD